MDRTTEKWHYGLASPWLHDTLVTSWHDDGKTELLVGNDASPYYTGIIVISGKDLDIHERRAREVAHQYCRASARYG